MSLLITGASGQLGRRVAELLLDESGVDPAELVLVTRSPDGLSAFAERGVQVRAGDFSDPSTLGEAFRGATRLLLISTTALGEARITEQRAAVDAARAAGVELIAYTSVPNPDPQANPAAVVPDHAATEEAIRQSGIPYAFLRNALYGELRIGEATGAIATGVLTFNTGEGATTFVSREDCARAAAAILAGGEEHANRTYTITGSELLTGTDLAALYGAIGDREVQPRPQDDEAYAAGLRDHGMPDEMVPLLVSFGTAIRVGAFDQHTDDLRAITGREPLTLRETLDAAGLGRG